jgi:CRISPR type I-E-associated protein CasB/Cse2
MKRDPRFKGHDSPEAAILRSWHKEVLGQRRRGDCAQLKRAGTIEEVAMVPAYHDLLRRLGIARPTDHVADQRTMSQLAAVAALAARVKEQPGAGTPPSPLGATLAQRREGGSAPRVSPARFRRLLESEQLDERFAVLRRLLPLVDREVDLVELAAAICDWSPRRRRRLAYDYYANAPLTSKTSEETPS